MDVAFLWNDSYSVHNSRVDEEHKKLLALASEVFAISNPAAERERFTATVKQLFEYMEYHFQSEEELMTSVSFPGREAHREQHADIVNRMNTLLKSCKNLRDLSAKLQDFMRRWVLEHILREDRKVGAAVLASGKSDKQPSATQDLAAKKKQGWALASTA